MLRLGYAALPRVMGIDKYFNGLVYWPKYLADWIDNIAPGTAHALALAQLASVYDPPLRLRR